MGADDGSPDPNPIHCHPYVRAHQQVYNQDAAQVLEKLDHLVNLFECSCVVQM